MAVGESDSPVQLWNTISGRRIAEFPLRDRNGESSTAGFSPNGKTLAIDNGRSDIQLWNIATRHPEGAPLHFFKLAGGPDAFAFSSNGKILAVANYDTVELWDLSARRELGRPLNVSNGKGNQVLLIAFNQDRTLTVVTSVTAQLWDVANQHRISAFTVGSRFAAGTVNNVENTAYYPTGKILAIENGDTIDLWNMATQHRVGVPLVFGVPYPAGLEFSPDGKTLAVMVGGNAIQLWDISTGKQIGGSLEAEIARTENVVTPLSGPIFSPDGRSVIAWNFTSIWRWNIALPAHLLGAACSIASRSRMRREWKVYIPYESFTRICE